MRSSSIILLVFAGALLGHNSVAQERAEKASGKKDSYSSVKSRANTSDIQRLLRDAEKLKTKDPKAALENVQEALAMSIAEEDHFNEGKSYVLLGEINESIQEWKLALDNYLTAYQKLSPRENQEDRKKSLNVMSVENDGFFEIKKVLTGLGNTTFKLGQFDDALKYYQQLLTTDLNAEEKAECQLSISEVYYAMKDYDQALKVLDETTDLSKKKNSALSIRIQNQRAKIYLQQNQLDKTQKLYSNSLQDIRSGQAAPSAAVQQSTQETKEEIAGALKEQEKYDDEINLRREAIAYNLETNNLPEVTRDKLAISSSLATKGDIPEALKEAEEAVLMADTIANPKEQANAYLSLADLYERSGKSAKAIMAYKKYSCHITSSQK